MLRYEDYKKICEMFEMLCENESIPCNFDENVMNVAGLFYGREGRMHTFDYDGTWLLVDSMDKGYTNDPVEALKKLKRSKAHCK